MKYWVLNPWLQHTKLSTAVYFVLLKIAIAPAAISQSPPLDFTTPPSQSIPRQCKQRSDTAVWARYRRYKHSTAATCCAARFDMPRSMSAARPIQSAAYGSTMEANFSATLLARMWTRNPWLKWRESSCYSWCLWSPCRGVDEWFAGLLLRASLMLYDVEWQLTSHLRFCTFLALRGGSMEAQDLASGGTMRDIMACVKVEKQQCMEGWAMLQDRQFPVSGQWIHWTVRHGQLESNIAGCSAVLSTHLTFFCAHKKQGIDSHVLLFYSKLWRSAMSELQRKISM